MSEADDSLAPGFGVAHPRGEGKAIHPDDMLYTVYWTEEEYRKQLEEYEEDYGEAEGG